MNTTVKSLQDVYVSMGGQLTDTYEDIAGGIPVSDYTTNPDVIAALAQIAGSTIELPGVSEADNGEVLTVVDGAWSKAPVRQELPIVTEADDGSFLRVVNGSWNKASVPTAESEEY